MSDLQIIGVDVGTNSAKGALVTARGRVLSRASAAYAPDLPAAGFVEQDAAVWWDGVVQVIHKLLACPEVRPAEVAGIGVSGLFPALVVAGPDGVPLRPAILYSDNRAGQELDAFRSAFMTRATGDAIAPKLRWLRRHEPDTLRKAVYFFSAHNYIVYCLTGCYCLDYKVADAFQGMLDPDSLAWRADAAEWAGIDAASLPPLKRPHDIAGRLLPDVAEHLGLPSDIPVIAGSGDSLLTFLSAGAINQGDALISFGTTGWMGSLPRPLEASFLTPALMTGGAPYRLDPYVLTLGAALQWYQTQFTGFAANAAHAERMNPFQILDDLVAQIPAGCDGVTVIPAFGGSRSEDAAVSAILGLTLRHGSVHVYRAILESFGFMLRSAVERLRQENISPSQLICMGGGAKSALWRQIVSDIIGLPLTYHPEVDPCLGDAFLVAYALRIVESFEAILSWLPAAEIIQPAEASQRMYNDAHSRFVAAEKWIRGLRVY